MKTNILTNIRVWAIMMVCLMMLGVGNAWGDSVTFDATSDLGENSTNGTSETPDAVTKGVITVTSSNGPMGNTNNYRVYQDGTLTISGATITKVKLTCTAEGSSQYGPQKLSGSGYTGGSSYNGEWSGSSSTVTLTASAQVRITEIVVTYTPAAPSTVTFNAQGGTCGTSSLTEASGGAGVTLPVASPNASCSSEGWAFYGWATAQCASSTTTAPAIVGKAGDTYKPAADITLHAVYYQLTGGTSTATFNPSTLTGLTQLSSDYKRPAQYVHDASNIELYIKDYGIYSSTWDIDNTVNNGNGWGYIKSPYKIQSVAITVSSGYAVDHIAESDAGSAELSTSGTSQTITCTGDVYTIYLYAANNGESRMTTFTITYSAANFYSNPSCCDKAVAVSYNSAGSSHVSAMTFSTASTATCGEAASRRVTITVTPTSGYLFKAGDELTWTKSSGTIPADPTLVSGPTLNAGKYEFVYEFAQNDNGAGTFAATASTLTNYRTVCCTEYDIVLNNSGSATGGTFSASKARACEGNEVTLTATPDACYVFGSWTIKKHSDNSDVTTSVLAGNTLTMPDYAVDVYATFTNKTVSALSLSMTGGHQNLDIGGTNQLLVSYTPADAICDNAIDTWSSSNSLILDVNSSGLVTAVSAGSATITATTEGGVSNTYTITVNSPACDSWFMHHWNNSTNGDECFYQYSGTDWRTNNISLPSSSSEEKFNVNNAASNPDAKKKDVEFNTLGFADIQRGGQSCGSNPYPGQNAYGKMGIYTNSGDNNRFVAFYPDKYMVTYGKEGQPWNTLVLSNTEGYEYESPVFQVPNGYKNDNTYKYYVGINNSSDAILFVTGKSSTDAMNGVSGLSSSDMGGKWGKWHIYSNSCANNWYCEFIRYYQVDFALNGGEGSVAPRYGKTTTPYVTFNTSEITPPTKSGYTFLGWSDGVNTYAPSGATVTIDGDKTLTAQWAANHTLSYNYNGGDGSSCVGGTKYTGESFTACSSAGDKEGHTFTGWLGSNSVSYTAGSSYSMPDADLTLTAQWNPDVYNITYKDQGDAAYSGNKTDGRPTGNPATHTYGSATALVDGVKDGYRFDGWYTNSTCTEGPVTSIGATAKTADFTLYAKWTQIWTISWKIWNNAESRYDEYAGDGTHTTEVVAGGTISKIPTNPADNALSSCASKFMGWSETALGSDLGQSAPGDLFTTTPVGSITENKTYYAVFASINVPEKWTKTALGSITAGTYVLLDANDKAFNGTINGDKHGELTENAFSFVAGEATSAPEGICEMEFQAVSGGFKMYNPKTERFLYATAASSGKLAWAVSDDDYWYLNNSNWTYSATYSGNHPIVRTYNNLMRSYAPSTTNGIALVVAKKTPGTWKDYVTSCCGTAAVTNGGYTNVTGSGSTMSAKVTWTDAANTNRYRVVCEDLSIDAISTNKYYTTAGVMTSCTDYTFNVYAAPEGGCQSAPLEITVSPVEAAKTVTFNYNGSGQATGSFTTDCTHSSTNLPTPDAYAGHRFDGWWTLASGGSSIGAAGASYTPTADIEIFAHWVAIADLTYSGDATGTCTGTSSKDVGTSVTACTPASREHYTFDYWIRSDNSEHVNAGATFTMPAAALTLTAHWTADSYSITYKDKGNVAYSGSNSSSLPATYSYGTGVPSLPNGVKEGFRFDGWFDNSDCTGSPITTISTTATGVKTFYAKWTASHTFTFSKNGVVDGELTLGQVEGGNVVMPNTTVDCGLWTTFEGWVENDVAETTTEPATIYKPGDIFFAGNSNQEFKAVYSKHEGDASVYYEKVTSGPKSGTYVIAGDNTHMYIFAGYNANNSSGTYGTKAEDHTFSGSDANIITSKGSGVEVSIIKSSNGKFAIKSGSYCAKPSNPDLNTQTTDAANALVWQMDANGYIQEKDATTYFLQINSSNKQFKCYTGTQWPAYLYRKRVAGTTYYTTAPGSCEVPTEITVSYNDNKANAGDQTISGMPSGTTLTFTDYPDFDTYTVGSAPTDPTGYHFTGWNTSAEGGGDSYDAGEDVTTFGYVETITLYAQWERVYTVTLYDNGVERTRLTQASAGANVTLPSGNNCTPGSAFTFVGWTDSPVQLNAEPVRPNIVSGAGEWGDDELTDDITLYSVYSKSVAGCDDFAAGVSGAYKMYYDGSTYATTAGSTGSYTGASSGTAEVFYIAYAPAHTGYTIRTSTGFVGWNYDGSELTKANATPYYWKISGSSSNWVITPEPSAYTKQLKSTDGSKFQLYAAATSGKLLLQKSAMTYYYNTASCGDNSITFHDGGGSISGTPTTPTGASWNSGTHILSGLEDCDKITEFPTASYDGWTFIGWSTEDYSNNGKHTTDYVEENASTDEPDGSGIYKTDGNPYVVRGGSIDMYPIFTRFPENEPFNTTSGGDYYIYYLEPGSNDGYGALVRQYAGEYDNVKRYGRTTSCAAATEFTFTKDGDVWHIYDKTKGKYVTGKTSDDWLVLASDLSGSYDDWTITIRSGNQFDATCGVGGGRQLSFSTAANYFMNYELAATPGYPPVYLGTCTERIFSSEPNPTPTVDLTGEPMVTSSKGQTVRAAIPMTLSASHITGTSPLKVTITGTNLKFATSAAVNTDPATSLEVAVDGSGKIDPTTIYVYYTPTEDEDGIENITVTAVATKWGPTEIKRTTGIVHARHLPEDFVIATKLGDKWYALPANCTTNSSSTEGMLIEVDDVNDPTAATAAPASTKYGLRNVAPKTRKAGNGERMVFTERISTATADNQMTLYNGSSTNIQVNAMYTTYKDNDTEETREKYEWTPETSDFKDYLLTSASASRTLSMNTSGVFGSLTKDKAYSGQVRLLPATFYTPADMQVVEWKANSVVVMYTGSGVTATTKVGTNSESSAQTLTTAKVDHGVFELTTNQALTSNANTQLLITIKNGSSAVVGKKALVIPAIINTDNKTADYVVSGADAAERIAKAATTDVVILDGAVLSAVATKYTYKNITVYPGGKLVIGSGNQLGMASLTLRGGSSWGAAEYEHKYPQFIVNNATDGAYSNTAVKINYDYVTTKAQYYTFVLPYTGNTSTIKYPVDIYGKNLDSGSQASFEFQYYDGAARAAGGTGWATLAEPADLVAGRGYTFLGMPRKVDAYDGTDNSHSNTRQTYGIHRIPMSVSASTVQSGETNSSPGKSTPISVTLADKNNASGWVLVGNPFMGDVTGLSNTDIQVGNLIHSDTNPWDGKWRWNPESSQRFVVIPDNSGLSYSSEEVSTAELPAFKNFFVQIKSSSVTSLVIPASSRDDAGLAPARYVAQEVKDIRLAVDLVSDTKSDKVDFLINDTYSAAYDDDADFTKMMNGTNFNLYGVYPGDNLSFIAVDKTTAAGSIAIGYQVPAAGEYTLQLSERPYVMSDYVETLLVTDHEVDPEVTTDLLENPYTFTVTKAETNDTRFTVSIKLKENQDTPTDMDIINGGGDLDGEKPIKFIYHDKMYILRNGVLYDATGKRVKEINK